MSLAGLVGSLGAPGVLVAPPEPVRMLTGVRRDVAAFLGVAPRGPAWLPRHTLEADVEVASWLDTTRRRRSIAVPVTSWDEYRRTFGGFEGPGRLPYAVSTFFAGGGRRAYVVRIVPEHADRLADAPGRAHGRLGELATPGGGHPIELWARNEGTWGNHLRATLRFRTRPIAASVLDPTRLVVDVGEWVPGGSTVRLAVGGDLQELRTVDSSIDEPNPSGPGRRRVLTLTAPASAAPERVEVVTASLEVVDDDPAFARREVIDGIGLRADHPRWLARVLVRESTLLWPGRAWAGAEVAVTDARLEPVSIRSDGGDHLTGGVDLWDVLVPEDFWDAGWVPGDEEPGDGVQCLGDLDDVGLVLAPDLYEPEPLAPVDDVVDPATFCGPDFAEHVDPGPPPPPSPPAGPGLAGLALDPRDALARARIVANQSQLVAYAEARRELTVLLDVPPRLSHRQVLEWRTQFDSPFAAAYHPWLDVASSQDSRDALIRLNPSAFAAAIVAERESRLGVQHGPANEIARGAVRVAVEVTTDEHDDLHVHGVNVFVPERDGIRLTGARTLSLRPALRQLSVARLMTVLRLTLEREVQWAVFEPNDRALWAEVRRLVHGLLTRLDEAGAFRGATAKESFFVRCDETTTTRNDLDAGRLVCLVGVAPAEPIEHLVLQIALAGTDGVRVEVVG